MKKIIAGALGLVVLCTAFLMPLPLDAGNKDLSLAVYTPNGTVIPQEDTFDVLASSERRSINNIEAAYLANGAERLREPDPTYNCFAYAFYERDCDKRAVWFSDPTPFIEDGSYVEIDRPVVGAIVLFSTMMTVTIGSPTGPLSGQPRVDFTHAAVVVDVAETEDGTVSPDDVTCVSKWGNGSLIRHSLKNCCYWSESLISLKVTQMMYLNQESLPPRYFVFNPENYASLKLIDETVSGESVGTKNGLYRDVDSVVRFYRDGIPQYVGLVSDEDGRYYYINSRCEDVTDVDYAVMQFKANGLLPEGTYSFDENGVLRVLPESLDGHDVRNGLIRMPDGRISYVVECVPQHSGAVRASDGSYYYINSAKTAVADTEYAIDWKFTNRLLPNGAYSFDEAAIMGGLPAVISDTDADDFANGLLRCADGRVLYCENGEPQYAGLIADADGNYYYINSALSAVHGEYGVTAARSNGLLAAARMLNFGENGVLVDSSLLLNADE